MKLSRRKRAYRSSLVAYLALFIAVGTYAVAASAEAVPGEEAITFTANSGETTRAFAGVFEVPEFRDATGSKTIKLRYVRFPSTAAAPGDPIVYLAGGPGGSGIGTAKWRRFPLFQAMRAYGDVIALDQRGTGDSDAPPECISSALNPGAAGVSDAEFVERHRSAIRECEAFWTAQGADLRGYTTRESVKDLSDLRQHLGAHRISLWGISYGSHLALAAMKAMPDELNKVIIASVEGLDQTVKLPSRTDDYLARLGAARGIDGLPELIRQVLDRLDEEPVSLDLVIDDESVPYLLQRRDLQMMTAGAISDPQWADMIIKVYEEIAEDNYDGTAKLLARFVYPDKPIVLRAMPTAMDRASGISAERLGLVREQAKTSLLGDYLNFPMPQVLSELAELDLGDDFRTRPISDIPTLVLMGTLDGRTYPVGQREATSGLSNVAYVTVDGAGHNLFMASPKVAEVMGEFLSGTRIEDRVIAVD